MSRTRVVSRGCQPPSASPLRGARWQAGVPVNEGDLLRSAEQLLCRITLPDDLPVGTSRPDEAAWLDAMPEAFVLTDEAANLLFANRMAERLLSRDEVTNGRSLLEIISVSPESWRMLVEGGHSAPVAIPIGFARTSTSQGPGTAYVATRSSIRGAAYRGWLLRSGVADPPLASGLYGDVWQRLPVVGYVISPEDGWRVLHLDPMLRDLAGYARDEWGRGTAGWLDHIHPDDRDRVQRARAVTWETGRILGTSYRLITRTGRVRSVHDVATVGRVGRRHVLVGALVEIAGDPRDDVRGHGAAEVGESATHIVAGLAHDLRSPLGAAKKLVSSLHGRLDDPVAAHELLTLTSETLESAIHLLHRVDELRDLEQREIRWTSFSLDRLIERRAGIDRWIDVQLTGPETRVLGDRELIDRAVAELTENAGLHTPPGTDVQIRKLETRSGALIVVDDDGPGIPDDLKEVVFEPFNRGMAPESRTGTGLGLAFVRSVAARHGGAAWLEDRPGGGTSARLRLSRS